jgi:hypothetical protein
MMTVSCYRPGGRGRKDTEHPRGIVIAGWFSKDLVVHTDYRVGSA